MEVGLIKNYNHPLVTARNLVKRFPTRNRNLFSSNPKSVEALIDISLKIRRGETVSVVGESGCGKSTLAKILALLIHPDHGTITIDGVTTNTLSPGVLKSFRQKIHLIFQDPYSSLNPRLSVGDIVMEPLIIQKVRPHRYRTDAVAQALHEVGMQPTDINKYPHQFSGGQRQRIAIARAIVAKPDLIIADEPLSALDVSIQSQIINLLMAIKRKHNLTYLLISHDLSVVSYLSDHVIVMYQGHVVESGPAESVFRMPLHPYTRQLISAIPKLGKGKRQRSTNLSKYSEVHSKHIPACPYYTRCQKSREICRFRDPFREQQVPIMDEHFVACHFPEERSQLELINTVGV